MNEDRFTIEVLTEEHWQIEDTLTGEFANPVDGTTNVLKGLVNSMNKFYNENEQLKQQCEELRNNLIDHSALIDMLEKTKALDIEDIIWNTMGYETQTEFDNDFADYRENAKKKWKE